MSQSEGPVNLYYKIRTHRENLDLLSFLSILFFADLLVIPYRQTVDIQCTLVRSQSTRKGE